MRSHTEAIHFLDTLVSTLDSGIISFDMEGYVTMVNDTALEYLGIDKSARHVLDTYVLDHIQQEDVVKKVEKCLVKSRKGFHLSNVYHNQRYLIIDGKKLLDGMLLCITDVTNEVMARDKATQSLLLGQESERRRLAKEIHDGVGPSMSTLKLQLDALKKKIDDPRYSEAIARITENISEIAQDIRQISHDLMPSSLIDFGVVTAISNFSSSISTASDIEIEYQSNIADKALPQEYELNIYRIVQELVNNAIKHSQCKSLQINLIHDMDMIKIFVQDDGVGMETQAPREGIGLTNVSNRVESLQGRLELESVEGGGVSVHIELPVSTINNDMT